MLDRDSLKTETLKSIKSAMLYKSVEKGKKDQGLSDEEALGVISSESKKRGESIAAYNQAGNSEAADKERQEKKIIDQFLPEGLSDAENRELVDQAIAELGIDTPSAADTGKIIGYAKSKTDKLLDSGAIAKIVQEKSR